MDGHPAVTVEEIAEQYGIDPITVYRWSSRKEWLDAIADTTGSTIRYDSAQVEDLIRKAKQSDAAPLTVREIAAKYEVSLDTVHRWVRDPQWQEAVVGMRGVAKEYDPERVDALARERIWLPPKQTSIPAGKLLTLTEIAEYTGIAYPDVRHMAAEVSGRGSVLGDPDAVDGDRRMWRRQTVDERVRGRQKRQKRKNRKEES